MKIFNKTCLLIIMGTGLISAPFLSGTSWLFATAPEQVCAFLTNEVWQVINSGPGSSREKVASGPLTQG